MNKRSKRYRAAVEQIDRQKKYPLAEAVALAQQTSQTKFTGSVEIHVRLGIDPAKADQTVRGTVTLPHDTDKKIKLAVFAKGAAATVAKKAGADLVGDADLIAEIKKTERTDFDVAMATPEMMKLLAPIAKILGTKGLMPNPKNDTVIVDPAAAVAAWRKGKIAFRSDASGNVHAAVGKTSQPAANLLANAETFVAAVKKAKPTESKGVYIRNISVAGSMSPGIRVDLSSL